MPQPQPLDLNVPLLTEVVHRSATSGDFDALLAEVQTALAARTFALADELLRAAFAEMQAALYEQVSSKLRRQLPELIDATLREHFDTRSP